MTLEQLITVLTNFIGTYGTTGSNSTGLMKLVFFVTHIFYPSGQAYYDSSGLLILFVSVSLVGLGIGLIRRIIR